MRIRRVGKNRSGNWTGCSGKMIGFGDKRWIWALVASQFVFYTVAAHRSAEVLVSLLGVVFRGILCSDRLPVY